MEDKTKELEQLARAIKQRNVVAAEIARIVDRPALIGSVGEYIAAWIFGIQLEQSAVRKGIDGHFARGNLAGKTVNIK